MNRWLVALALIAACGSQAWGKKTANLRSTFLSNTAIPLTVDAATESGWVEVDRPSNALLQGLTMYCPSDDVTLCALFINTYVAGVQISLPVDYFTDNVPSDLTDIGFKTWTPTIGNYPDLEHWYNNIFFVSEETLSKTDAEIDALCSTGEVLYEDGVWVPNVDGETLMFISGDGSVDGTLWQVQACIPFMGVHYYYDMTTSSSCDAFFPWFTLVDDGQLIGLGFMAFGANTAATKSGQTVRFEDPASIAVKAIVPNAPECLYTYADSPGVTTMHVYFIDNPYSVGCTLSSLLG